MSIDYPFEKFFTKRPCHAFNYIVKFRLLNPTDGFHQLKKKRVNTMDYLNIPDWGIGIIVLISFVLAAVILNKLHWRRGMIFFFIPIAFILAWIAAHLF